MDFVRSGKNNPIAKSLWAWACCVGKDGVKTTKHGYPQSRLRSNKEILRKGSEQTKGCRQDPDAFEIEWRSMEKSLVRLMVTKRHTELLPLSHVSRWHHWSRCAWCTHIIIVKILGGWIWRLGAHRHVPTSGYHDNAAATLRSVARGSKLPKMPFKKSPIP